MHTSTIELKCLTRRADLLTEEAKVVGGALGMTWGERLRDIGDYGRSGGSAADRRQIIETLAAIEQGAVKVNGTDLFSLQVLTRDADLLAKAAKRVTTARLTWEGLATIEPTPGSFAALASMMTFIERGTVTAQTIPPLDLAADGDEREFTVTWKYTASAATAEEAAREAWRTVRGPDSIANVFTVQPKAGGATVEVDLAAIDGHPDA